MLDEATRAVAETLDVDLVDITEHLGDGRARMRAGVGWPEGFVGSEFEMASLRATAAASTRPVVVVEPADRQRVAGAPLPTTASSRASTC